MPEIARFYGIVITLYYADHEPPHFHARYQDHEALYRIDDGAILRGALPERAARLVSEWAAMHGQDLALDWQLARDGRPLLPIEPLR
jgi:hypothetical protein